MSQGDDSVFDSHPVDTPSAHKTDKERVTNKLLDKLKILDHWKTVVKTLSESEKGALTPKCSANWRQIKRD